MSVSRITPILAIAAAFFLQHCESPTESNGGGAKEGRVYFQYKIDGGSWQEFEIQGKDGGADTYSKSGQGVSADYYSSTLGTGMVFKVEALKYNSASDVDQFIIWSESSISEGKEYTVSSNLGYEPDIHFSIGASSKESVHGDYEYQLTSGTMKIVTYDESTGQISGTFSGTVSAADSSTIDITSGTFLVYVE